MYIFLLIASIIFGSAHYYAFVRLSDYLELSTDARVVILTITASLCFAMVISLPLMRMVSRRVASLLAWVIFSWMGILMFLVLSLLAADIILLISNLVQLGGFNIPLNKHILGYAVIAATVILSIISLWKAVRPVMVKDVSVKLARLPKEMDGLRIVQITDLHIGPTISGKKMLDVIKKVNVLNPEIVVITGDLVDGSVAELKEHILHLMDLHPKYGTYFVTGNHEYYSGVDEWVAYLSAIGVKVLRNEIATIYHNGHAIDLAGVDDYHGHQDIPAALAGRNQNTPVILLAHQPAAIEEASLHNVDLQISGHTHGGQIWPWNYAVRLQQPYVNGLHKHKNTQTQIYISSGTGYWGPPMRLGTKAEITNITLVATEK